MELVPYTVDDMWLTEALETDPRVMADLGGPWTSDDIPGTHERRLAAMADGALYLKVVPDPETGPVGAITVWQSEFEGAPIVEAGWMILPEHQGRGYASAAVAMMLDLARRERGWTEIHAFTSVDNGASNHLCRKLGFELLGDVQLDYRDRKLHCNHWVRRI